VARLTSIVMWHQEIHDKANCNIYPDSHGSLSKLHVRFSYPEDGTNHERRNCSDSTRIHDGNGR
jgi:hypothetical protein